MSKLIKNIKLKMARLLVLPQVKAVIQLLQYIYNIFVHPINLKVLKINIGVITILQLMTPVVEFISWHSSEYYQLFVVWVMFGFGVYYTQFLKSIFVKHLFRLPCLGYFILAIIIVILDIVRYNSDFPVHEVQNFWIGFIFIYSAYYIGWFILFGLNFSKKWLVNNSVSIPVFGFLLPVYLLISTFGFTSTTLGWSGLIYFACMILVIKGLYDEVKINK